MTKQQIKWASTHDWFVSAIGDGCIVSDVVFCSESKQSGERTLEFTDFTELWEWAGY